MNTAAKHHVIISGTGRAGTTFLVQLLTALNLDTGFKPGTTPVFAHCNAGMEQDIRKPNAPYIIKSPWLCEHLSGVLASGETVIDHAFIPMRDLFSAAESRRSVQASEAAKAFNGHVPGGLWGASDPRKQEESLTERFYSLVDTLVEHDIPMTFLRFPRFVHDSTYLYRKLGPVLQGVSFDVFNQAFEAVARPELVHDFLGQKIAAVG